MTKPQQMPAEEARKKFADLLDGTQFRGEHAAITRRGKPAGYLVPPEWHASAVEAIAEVKALRKQAVARAATEQPEPEQPESAPAPTQHPPVQRAISTLDLNPRVARLIPPVARDLAALAAERADTDQVQAMERAARSPGDGNFWRVDTALRLGILTDSDLDA